VRGEVSSGNIDRAPFRRFGCPDATSKQRTNQPAHPRPRHTAGRLAWSTVHLLWLIFPIFWAGRARVCLAARLGDVGVFESGCPHRPKALARIRHL